MRDRKRELWDPVSLVRSGSGQNGWGERPEGEDGEGEKPGEEQGAERFVQRSRIRRSIFSFWSSNL